MEPIPSAKGVVAVAGTQPPRYRIDINKDGIDDLSQVKDLWLKNEPIAEMIIRFLLLFIRPHTKVGGWLNAYFTHAKPAIEAVLKDIP